jgi:hypothetical protein
VSLVGLLNLHDRGSVFLQGNSNVQGLDSISARMAYCATMPLDHIIATATCQNVVWRERRLLNLNALQRLGDAIPVLPLCLLVNLATLFQLQKIASNEGANT